MKFRGASEIEKLYSAVALVKPRYYNHGYLNAEMLLPHAKIRRALLDFSEVGRILKREQTVLGENTYDCSVVDIEILEAGLWGDFELCILDNYEYPFQTRIRENPKKKNVMKRFSIIVNNYMDVLSPHMNGGVLEVGDYEDQCQIDTARAANCDCIITSDHHLLQLTEKRPYGTSPEAFAKLMGISLGDWDSFFKFTRTPRKKVSKRSAEVQTLADFMNPSLKKFVFYY